MNRTENLLFYAVEKFQRHDEIAKKTLNPKVKEFASKMQEISLWEFWELTQGQEKGLV